MGGSCDFGEVGGGEYVTAVRTVTAGFIRQVLDLNVFVYYMDKEEGLLRRCLVIEGMLECREYQDDNKEVSIEIDRLFRELTNDAIARFKILLPVSKSHEEVKNR